MVAGSVDVDAQVARRYGVQSMPTLLVFRDGQPVARIVGARGAVRLGRTWASTSTGPESRWSADDSGGSWA